MVILPVSYTHLGVINTKGKYIVEPQYQGIKAYANGYAAFVSNGKVGYLDKKGRVAIEPQFDYGGQMMSDGYAVLRVGNYYGIINEKG